MFLVHADLFCTTGCRFPGDSETPEQFWEMLLENRNCYSEPPISRYNINGHYANSSRPGSLKSRGAYFLSDTIYNFDPLFFAVTPAEAAAMDPQQRKLMECIFEAFENGGIPLEKISGTNTGVSRPFIRRERNKPTHY
jgi:acyl transferase domain-containing protein